MNSIGNDWDSTKRAKNGTYFHCGPSCQNETEAKGKTKNKKEKHENGYLKGKHTKICPYVYIRTPTDTQTYTYRYTYSDIHIMCYSSQIVFLDIMFESIETIHKLFHIEGPI